MATQLVAREDGGGAFQDLQLQPVSLGGTVGTYFSDRWSRASTLELERGRWPGSGDADGRTFQILQLALLGLPEKWAVNGATTRSARSGNRSARNKCTHNPFNLTHQ